MGPDVLLPRRLEAKLGRALARPRVVVGYKGANIWVSHRSRNLHVSIRHLRVAEPEEHLLWGEVLQQALQARDGDEHRRDDDDEQPHGEEGDDNRRDDAGYVPSTRRRRAQGSRGPALRHDAGPPPG